MHLKKVQRGLYTAALCLMPVCALLGLWGPALIHYYIGNIPIPSEVIEKGRISPGDHVLDELSQMCVPACDVWGGDGRLVSVAEILVSGRLDIPDVPPTQISIPFDQQDLEREIHGSPALQLVLASFTVPHILLNAYERSGNEEFIKTAWEIIKAWDSYERMAWLPKGLMWNDHAVAARVNVLAEFWRLYRKHPDYQPEVGEIVFRQAARCGALLSKNSMFTFSTNHGVMQNLALLHLSLSFPSLSEVESYKTIGINRLQEQMGFYVNEEGVVLEHSASYQEFGMILLGMGLRYLTLLERPIPDSWINKYEQAKIFYAYLRRPDGSLPTIGDTHGSDHVDLSVVSADGHGGVTPLEPKRDWAPAAGYSLFPVAGYSVWWGGSDQQFATKAHSQSLVAWSHFSGHAHKHADELSVILWAGGQTWLTNVGYWPYGMEGRAQALSWDGSNAPHLKNEPSDSYRQTQLLFHGWSKNLAIIDLERQGPDKYSVRRQVIQIEPSAWIILDSTHGNESTSTITNWTTAANVQINKVAGPGSYILTGTPGTVSMVVSIAGSPNPVIKELTGSLAPFVGWEAGNARDPAQPASAIVVEQPTGNGWTTMVLRVGNEDVSRYALASASPVVSWNHEESWKIVLPGKSMIEIVRKGADLAVDHGSESQPYHLSLVPGPHVENARTRIQEHFVALAKKYPGFDPQSELRQKATKLLLGLVLLQEVLLFLWGWIYGTTMPRVRVAVAVVWLVLGTGLAMFFNDIVNVYHIYHLQLMGII